jgi:hypothetical protein
MSNSGSDFEWEIEKSFVLSSQWIPTLRLNSDFIVGRSNKFDPIFSGAGMSDN